MDLLNKSAEQSHRPAMRAYAFALEFGKLGLDRNSELALHWYQLCNDAGDSVCARRLVQAYEKGDLGQPADENKADELRRRLNQIPAEG